MRFFLDSIQNSLLHLAAWKERLSRGKLRVNCEKRKVEDNEINLRGLRCKYDRKSVGKILKLILILKLIKKLFENCF